MERYARYRKRVGIDLDSVSRLRFLITYLNARLFGKVKAYETMHGYHLRIKTSVDLKTDLHIRHILGDDPWRLGHDEYKAHLGLYDMVDTLFHAKMHKGRFVWERRINPLAEPFWLLWYKRGRRCRR